MATKAPTSTATSITKKQSVKPGPTPTPTTYKPVDPKKTSLKPGEVAPPLDPNAKKMSLKPGEVAPLDDPKAVQSTLAPTGPPVFRPWLKILRPPWEKPPKPPPPQPRWKIFSEKMLEKYKLPAQVEFQDALWTRTMLDITMKKKYPQTVKMFVGPVAVTHELHKGPVQVYLQPLTREMPEYPECQKLQFSTNKPL